MSRNHRPHDNAPTVVTDEERTEPIQYGKRGTDFLTVDAGRVLISEHKEHCGAAIGWPKLLTGSAVAAAMVGTILTLLGMVAETRVRRLIRDEIGQALPALYSQLHRNARTWPGIVPEAVAEVKKP
jgi:hypothetical protein